MWRQILDFFLGLFSPKTPVEEVLGQTTAAAKVDAASAVTEQAVAQAAVQAPSTVKDAETSLDKGQF